MYQSFNNNYQDLILAHQKLWAHNFIVRSDSEHSLNFGSKCDRAVSRTPIQWCFDLHSLLATACNYSLWFPKRSWRLSKRISPFPFWPVTTEEGSNVCKQRQNCRPYSNFWCSKRHKNSFFEETQCHWQTMYLNWATELHCVRNTNRNVKMGGSAEITKSQVSQATSKLYSCALWVFKTIFFFLSSGFQLHLGK